MSNSTPDGVLNFDDVGSLLAKKIRKNSMDYGKQDAALGHRGIRQFRGKSEERGRSRSKLRNCKDIELLWQERSYQA